MRSGRRVLVWFLDFGIWVTFFVRADPPPVHVELDRKQFFSIELDFKIVLRDRALMLGSSRTRARRCEEFFQIRLPDGPEFLHR